MTTAACKRNLLRKGLRDSKPVTVVGAHDAMSAQLIEEAGFDAVWVSGFGVSTMGYALPDANLVTMSESLQAAMKINMAVNIPVIADCDNGFGGLTNVVRTVREYEHAGIAGICIEDNEFPKRNSLYQDRINRKLIPLKEQVRRIRAAKSAQQSDDFVFIARVESLIAEKGVLDAVSRADAYTDAGADAILIHSRDNTLSELELFLAEWHNAVPLVAVPTLFPDFTTGQLFDKGFQVVIMANQLMRASVKSMQETLTILRDTGRPADVETNIAPVSEIFDLVKANTQATPGVPVTEVAQVSGLHVVDS